MSYSTIPHTGREISQTRTTIGRYLLHPLVIAAGAVIYLLTLRHFDTRWLNVPFVCGVTLLIASVLFLFSRRYAFSLFSAGAIVLLIALSSMVKHQLKGFALHYYDLIFTGSDSSAVDFLIERYTSIFVWGLAILVATIAALCVVFLVDRPLRLRWPWRMAGVAAAFGLTAALLPALKPGEPAYIPYIDGYNASAFFLSLGHMTLPMDKLLFGENLDPAEKRVLADGVSCGVEERRPDVVYILAESQTDPRNFPQIHAPKDVLDSFSSGDGKTHPLYVENFGGGTWVTNFSVMTGLSATDFDWQSAYVTQLMQGRIRDSFPETLKRCGYRTVAIMPMPRSFVNEGAFLQSIGFQEIYDQQSLGLDGNPHDDGVYFAFAEKLIAEHRAKGDPRPLFIALQTMLAHGPYDTPLVPLSVVPDIKFADDPEANEYMRRVASARMAVEQFLSTVEDAPGPRGTVVMEYGDHQAAATKPYLEAAMPDGNIFSDFRSLTYRTFVAIHGFGVPVDYSVFDTPMDVGFVSSALVEAARLPTNPVMQELQQLRRACDGRYHSCQQRQLVDDHLTRRVNGGLISLN